MTNSFENLFHCIHIGLEMGGPFLIQKVMKDCCLKIFRPLQISELLVFLNISCLGYCEEEAAFWPWINNRSSGPVSWDHRFGLKTEKSKWVSLDGEFFFCFVRLISRLYWHYYLNSASHDCCLVPWIFLLNWDLCNSKGREGEWIPFSIRKMRELEYQDLKSWESSPK